ncbi:MAG: DUF86 domain-containing protein [Proteobacteria bacterium]|nr:DUF86 domain-containing protein [Pseudomonadota bacterium]
MKTPDRSATIRQFEIIGEATNALSREAQEEHPTIPWRLWADFRNVLIHQYFGVDYREVYTVVTNEMPSLKKEIQAILNEARDDSDRVEF